MEKVTKISKAIYWAAAAIGAIISLACLVKFLPKRSKAIESVLDCPEEIIPEEI